MSRLAAVIASLTATLALPSLLGSCSPAAPSLDAEHPGRYVASRFEVQPAGARTPQDFLAGGAAVQLVIAPTTQTSGRVIVPGRLTGEPDLDQLVSGHALDRADGTVEFRFEPAENFLESLRFRPDAARAASLAVDTVLGDGTRVGLVLRRVE